MMYSGFEPVRARMEAEAGFVPQVHPASFVNQTLAFVTAVRDGKPGENSLIRNFNTIAVLDAIGRSLASGKTESVEAL
jgi:predicted dehydrogenase